MIQFNISNTEIKSIASHQMAYHLGVSYFHGGRVEAVNYDSAKRQVEAAVSGNRRYRVAIDLTRSGSIGRYECNCSAFSKYYGACKHVIAVLKALQGEGGTSALKKGAQSLAAEELLAYFENNISEPIKDELSLELQMQIVSRSQPSANLLLKVGIQRIF